MNTRCVRCLLPNTYPNITLNDDGVCNYCLEYKKVEPIGEEDFLSKIKSKRGAQYDCVVGISGGKDSCYVAYLAKKKFGLRALAVSYDFPFMVELARKNIKTVCDHLGLELLVVRSSNNLEYNLLRNHMISLAATGTTWGQCMFCHYGIKAILYETAQKQNIPFILNGETNSEIWWNPGNRTSFLIKQLNKISISEKAIFGLYQSKAFYHLADQRRQFPIHGNNILNVYKRASTPKDGPETIHVFDYIEWDQDFIERTLTEETGWQKPSKALSWRYDCILEPVLDYTYKKEFGISSAGLYLCGLIRSGGIKREEALKILDECENQEALDNNMRNVFNFLDIPIQVQEKFFRASR
jgi:glucosamine--fructose-6-phosphate aminotransferase (isomerizing)